MAIDTKLVQGAGLVAKSEGMAGIASAMGVAQTGQAISQSINKGLEKQRKAQEEQKKAQQKANEALAKEQAKLEREAIKNFNKKAEKVLNEGTTLSDDNFTGVYNEVDALKQAYSEAPPNSPERQLILKNLQQMGGKLKDVTVFNTEIAESVVDPEGLTDAFKSSERGLSFEKIQSGNQELVWNAETQEFGYMLFDQDKYNKENSMLFKGEKSNNYNSFTNIYDLREEIKYNSFDSDFTDNIFKSAENAMKESSRVLPGRNSNFNEEKWNQVAEAELKNANPRSVNYDKHVGSTRVLFEDLVDDLMTNAPTYADFGITNEQLKSADIDENGEISREEAELFARSALDESELGHQFRKSYLVNHYKKQWEIGEKSRKDYNANPDGNNEKTIAQTNEMTFSEAFNYYNNKLGEGEQFEWNGNPYTTNKYKA